MRIPYLPDTAPAGAGTARGGCIGAVGSRGPYRPPSTSSFKRISPHFTFSNRRATGSGVNEALRLIAMLGRFLARKGDCERRGGSSPRWRQQQTSPAESRPRLEEGTDVNARNPEP